MINHAWNIIELGHGDVCVGGTWSGLTFQNIKPPQEIGTHLFRGRGDCEFLGEIIELQMQDIHDISDFEAKLCKVEQGECDFIAYTGWMIKFNGNQKSVKVVRTHFQCLKSRVLNCLAC